MVSKWHILTLRRIGDDDSRRKAASQETGTRMVIEEQMESRTTAMQNSGGPLKVTKMLAAVI